MYDGYTEQSLKYTSISKRHLIIQRFYTKLLISITSQTMNSIFLCLVGAKMFSGTSLLILADHSPMQQCKQEGCIN